MTNCKLAKYIGKGTITHCAGPFNGRTVSDGICEACKVRDPINKANKSYLMPGIKRHVIPNSKLGKHRPTGPTPQEIQGRYLWYELHCRTLTVRTEEEDKRWLETFTSRVPAGGTCKCKENWQDEIKNNPPPLGKDMFNWGIDRHDEVNKRKKKERVFLKPDGTLDYEEAREFWQKAAPLPDGYSLQRIPKDRPDPRIEIALATAKENFPPQKEDEQPINGELTKDQLYNLFDVVYVINLKRRPERLKAFYDQFNANSWPFKAPERFEAVDGDGVGKNSTWGCRESHAACLRDALNKGFSRVLILEDDAVFAMNFAEEVTKFMSKVPVWDGVWLGNESRGHFNFVAPGVLQATNPHRLHAYALRGKAMRAMYDWLVYGPRASGSKDWWLDHADHVTGEMLGQDFKIYYPDPLLAFQGGGYSDIKGQEKPFETFGNAARLLPYIGDKLVLLKCTREVREKLRGMGMHGGYSIGPNGADNWLNDQIKNGVENDKLKPWTEVIRNEAAMSGRIATVWAPDMPEPVLQTFKEVLNGESLEIEAADIQDVRNVLATYQQPEPDSKDKFWAYVVLRNGGLDLFPHWLKHYASLGADRLIIIVKLPVSDENNQIINQYYRQYNFTRVDQDLGASDRVEDEESKAVLRRLGALPQTWLLNTDLDEFQQYPEDLKSIGHKCYEQGINYVQGALVDRIAEGGELAPVLPEPSIFEQFPIQCNITGAILGGWMDKVMLSRYGVGLTNGHHGPQGLNAARFPVGLKEDYPVYHFKWKKDMIERLKWALDSGFDAQWKWRKEAQTIIDWVDKNGGKIDVGNKRIKAKRAKPRR